MGKWRELPADVDLRQMPDVRNTPTHSRPLPLSLRRHNAWKGLQTFFSLQICLQSAPCTDETRISLANRVVSTPTNDMSSSNLFSPLTVGKCVLDHRILMAPMTRRRAHPDYTPHEMMIEYYAQRASVRGSLLISEATSVSPRSSAQPNTPGLWSAEHIKAWRRITDAVHSKGSYIFVQLWMCGRAARPGALKRGAVVVSPSDIPISTESPVPTPLSEEEIDECIRDFVQAGINAIEAGFDGVEIHGANGYLVDQFTQEISNQRKDQWGGSIENRARFGIRIAQGLADAIGPERVGYRVSPWSHHHGMGMADPVPQFTYLVKELSKLRLAYLHVIESRVQGNSDVVGTEPIDFLIEAWGKASPVIIAGGYNAHSAREVVDRWKQRETDVAVAFGRSYISNPDLPIRVSKVLPLAAYRRDLFYEVLSPDGYTDYPTYAEGQESEPKVTAHFADLGSADKHGGVVNSIEEIQANASSAFRA